MFSSTTQGRTRPTGREPSLPGDKYNKLTLVSELPAQTVQRSSRKWLAVCDCGKEKVAVLSNITGGTTSSCGCALREAMQGENPVTVGQKFGRLTVTSMSTGRGDSRTYWNVVCDCGVVKSVYQNHLKSGVTLSCGCLRVETTTNKNLTHGQTYSPTYISWAHAKQRATNPNDAAWERYGGRGITMAERWLSFENFLADMGECPEGLTIDRIDNNKGYEPGNCRWATYTEQVRNRRNTYLVNYKGKQISLAEAVEIQGLVYSAVHDKLYKGRKTVSQALGSDDFKESTN